MILRFWTVLVAVALTLGAVGCATAPDPPPPDLSGSVQETETRMLSVSAAERSIRADLDRLQELMDSLTVVIESVERNDRSLPLLRLVAMNCMNTEYGDGVTEVVALEGMPLSCRPAHFARLQESLAEAPASDRDQALELLYVVDQVRILRGSMRRRLARLPRAIDEHRDFIVEERATLRRLEADLARRRALYSGPGWGEVIDRLSEHRGLLRDFEILLDELEEAVPAWPTRLDELTGEIYFALADIRSPESR